MTKYRLIERNDGYFEYEAELDGGSWFRIPYIAYRQESAARKSFIDMITFTKKAEVKRIVDEIEV